MTHRRRSAGRCQAVLAAVVVLAVPLLPGPAGGSSLAGSQGTDTALPLTDSAVKVSGRPCPNAADGCGFGDMKFTVSQTRGLVNQAISVTWTGGRPAVKEDRLPAEVSPAFGNFVQIFQCWGDDDGTNSINPGPPPEKCQFGGVQSNRRGTSTLGLESTLAATRVLSSADDALASDEGVRAADGQRWMPFHAVDGTVIDVSADNGADDFTGGAYWRNRYFNVFTTNELPAARTSAGQTGSELFTVATGLEAPGLGCGQRLEAQADGSTRAPRCWLVIVPRSTGADENPPGVAQSDAFATQYSPLASRSWRNRIAVPLEINPLDQQCAVGADERRIAGSELAGRAVSSWQPKLCAVPGAPPYSYSPLSDGRARQQLTEATTGAAGLAVVSEPLDPATLGPDTAALYAPLSISGVAIGFTIERQAFKKRQPDGRLDYNDPDEAPLLGVRVAQLNLTPRLVAKLLTQSYKNYFAPFVPSGDVYDWLKKNPAELFSDPDFLQFNPEFANLDGSRTTGRLVVELPHSDAATEVWRWVLADPEAAAWLAGAPDRGMQVNPLYSTNSAVNPSAAAFGDPVPDAFPKSDPFCHVDTTTVLLSAGNTHPRPICASEIAPYVLSMQDAAASTRAARDGSVASLDAQVRSPELAWKPIPPQGPGSRAILSITDSASAARYGLQAARLSRAGDDGQGRGFIAPDQAGLLAGQQAMVPSSVPDVLRPDAAAAAPGAYPLTLLTYAAALPASLDAASRKDYAGFIDYAVGDGQVPGVGVGQLPPGYAPLPDGLRAQARKAAADLRAGPVVTPPTRPAINSGAGRGGGSSPGGGGGSGSAGASGDAGGTGPGPTPGAGPVAAPLTPGAPPSMVERVLSTAKEAVGFLRFALPIAMGVGLAAALGVLLVDDRGFKALAAKMRPPPPSDVLETIEPAAATDAAESDVHELDAPDPGASDSLAS